MFIDKIISADCKTSSRLATFAPASTYFSSEAKAFTPALFSTTTSTFHFLRVAKCSGNKETLVSGDGSFKKPIIRALKYPRKYRKFKT